MIHSDALNEYEKLLVELHQEMKAGRSEGQKAEEIRDQMESPWYLLTKFERSSIDEASGDLYIMEERVRPITLAEGETQESIRKLLIQALRDNNHVIALYFFRKLDRLDAIHYYIVGKCWEQLGFSLIAKCFYEFIYEYELNLDRFFDEMTVKEIHDF